MGLGSSPSRKPQPLMMLSCPVHTPLSYFSLSIIYSIFHFSSPSIYFHLSLYSFISFSLTIYFYHFMAFIYSQGRVGLGSSPSRKPQPLTMLNCISVFFSYCLSSYHFLFSFFFSFLSLFLSFFENSFFFCYILCP